MLGHTLEKVVITKAASDEEYRDSMRDVLAKYKDMGVSSVAFGDIFLEDVKKYREDNLAGIGMEAIFPLWKSDTLELASAFIKLGFKAVITCVDSKALDKNFAGRPFDEQFLKELPSQVDPCGENGEFHSFVFDGPIFKERVPHRIGDTYLRDNRFYYCDLLPAGKHFAENPGGGGQ